MPIFLQRMPKNLKIVFVSYWFEISYTQCIYPDQYGTTPLALLFTHEQTINRFPIITTLLYNKMFPWCYVIFFGFPDIRNLSLLFCLKIQMHMILHCNTWIVFSNDFHIRHQESLWLKFDQLYTFWFVVCLLLLHGNCNMISTFRNIRNTRRVIFTASNKGTNSKAISQVKNIG